MSDKDIIDRLYKMLEYYKSVDIKDVKLEDLKDIRDVHIDTTKPVHERVFSFWAQIGNPYLFKVGDVKVKVEFNDNGPSLQELLESFFIKSLEKKY